MENTDDEALSWAGDESRMRGSGTWSVPKRAGGASPSSSPETPSPSSTPQPPAVERPASGWRDSVGLLVTGVLAGVYLLFSVAWLITAFRNPIAIADPLGQFMFTLGLWFAAAAPILVFIAIVLWRRGRGVGLRLLFLLIGALVLIPWPYLTWAA